MAAPTWDGWDRVLTLQKQDVGPYSDCYYPAQWRNMDLTDWIPQMLDTGITWDYCAPEVHGEAFFEVSSDMHTNHYDLWTPVGEEDTSWRKVNYPR